MRTDHQDLVCLSIRFEIDVLLKYLNRPADKFRYPQSLRYRPKPQPYPGPEAIVQKEDDAQSLSNVRGVIDTEDASTPCDDKDMAIRRQPPHNGKESSKELPLSTEARRKGGQENITRPATVSESV